MELSRYSIDKLESLKIATAIMITSAASEGHLALATDLKFWDGEIRLAIDDAKTEEEELPFKTKEAREMMERICPIPPFNF